MNDCRVKVLIIEDEIPIQRMILGMIDELRPEWEIVSVTSSVEGSICFLEEGNLPNIIFSDIQLSDGISFDIFSKLNIDCPIIFLTAYNQYAIKAFEVCSVDYLLKPINSEDLEKAIIKYENMFMKPSKSIDIEYIEATINALSKNKKEYRKRFLISHREDYFTLSTKDIAYIYSSNKISFAKTFSNKEYMLDYSLENLEQQLNPDIFYRANRKIIVNVESIIKIRTYFNGKLKIKPNPQHCEDIVVSRDKAKHFKQWLNR